MMASETTDDRGPGGLPPGLTIRCREHGPLVIEVPAAEGGPGVTVRVTDHHGREFPLPAHKRLIALCRCGQSKNRPFCDGSHRETGFTAGELAPDPGSGRC